MNSRLTIDEKVVIKKGMDLPSLLFLMLLKTGIDLPTLIKTCLEKQYIWENSEGKLLPTMTWSERVDDILLTKDEEVPEEDEIEVLADKLREIFPKQKKAGTASSYFRGNKFEITSRLKKFFKYFGSKGRRFTGEEILDAAQRYVDSFNGDYTMMRLLKYFIWKLETKEMPDESMSKEVISDLCTWIENKDSEENNSDWTTRLG